MLLHLSVVRIDVLLIMHVWGPLVLLCGMMTTRESYGQMGLFAVQVHDAALQLVRELRIEVEQWCNLMEDCKASRQRVQSDLTFDLDLPEAGRPPEVPHSSIVQA